MDTIITDPTKSKTMVSETDLSPHTPIKEPIQMEVRKMKAPSRYLIKVTTNGVITSKLKK